MRGGVTVRAQDLKTRLPEDMFGEIREMHPLLTPKLTNATIRRAVEDYMDGGARKQRVVKKCGDISMVLKRCSSERGEREKRFYRDGKDERRRTAF